MPYIKKSRRFDAVKYQHIYSIRFKDNHFLQQSENEGEKRLIGASLYIHTFSVFVVFILEVI